MGILRRILSRISKRSTGPDDLRHGGDPAEALAAGRSALLNLPISDGIGLHHFSLAKDGTHPFVRALSKAIDEPRSRDDEIAEISRVLATYYSKVQPTSAGEWLGLEGGPLFDFPPHATVMPWQAGAPSEWLRNRSMGIERENQLAGGNAAINEGWHACGPVSEQKLLIETMRLHKLLDSIRQNGLLRHDGRDGDMEAVLIRGNGTQKWWINYGHHRASVCASLGMEKVPVRIVRIIDASETSQLTQVLSGVYSADAAQKVLSRMLSADLPPICSDWAACLLSCGSKSIA